MKRNERHHRTELLSSFECLDCVCSLFYAQLVTSETDTQLQSLETLNELSGKLASSSSNPEITEDVRSVSEQVHAALPSVRDWSNRLPIMLQCFQHQQSTQRHVTFLNEGKARIDVEFCLDGVVDVENELDGVKVRYLTFCRNHRHSLHSLSLHCYFQRVNFTPVLE